MSAETFLNDYKKAVDAYIDEELDGGVSVGSRTVLSLVRAGLVIFAVTLFVPYLIAVFVKNGLFWNDDIITLIVLAVVLSVGGIYAFWTNKKSEERYITDKRTKRLKQIAHDLVTSDEYKDLKRDEAAKAAKTKSASLNSTQKAVSWIWKICYFLTIAIASFALAIQTDMFGFTLHMWYAIIPAVVFVVTQVFHCANEAKRCYLDLAAKVL